MTERFRIFLLAAILFVLIVSVIAPVIVGVLNRYVIPYMMR